MSLWPLSQDKSCLFAAGLSLTEWEEALGESLHLDYPWEILDLNNRLMKSLSEWPGHPEAKLVDGAKLQVGEGTIILPGVIIAGRVIIGSHCTIGPNCYLRDNTFIADHCHVGHAVEIKNSILAPHTAVGHLSYVGDSYLDREVNLGAGTVTANFRHDAATHRSLVEGELIETGRQKLGAIVGKGVHTGIHTSIYPGRKLGPGTSTLPGEIVSSDVSVL